ncbi:MAG: hypothetical protein WC390_04115 [Sulfurimonas sp.]
MRKNVCPNIEAGEFICAEGKTSVADFGFNRFSTLSYSVQFTSGNISMPSSSCSQAFLAGKRHAVELSSNLFSFKSA